MLIAVSGGADSIALLHLFKMVQKKSNLQLAVAHVNHQLRKESDADCRFVQDTANELNIPFFSDRQTWPVQNKRSVEEGAREFRYHFFHDICRKEGYQYLVTGHNLDDQAETVLMRMINGTGISGLAGIRYLSSQKNITIVRPMLYIPRADIRSALKQAGLKFKNDKSNFQDVYLRNKIRNRLIPYIRKEFNPSFPSHLVAIGEESQTASESINTLVSEVFNRHSVKTKDTCVFAVNQLIKFAMPVRVELYKQAYRYLFDSTKGLTRQLLHKADSLLQSEG
ncbi:MAG: tRNA lysidine(34) synthetase TilS, partial [Candidatus Omnitrophica bacterium]|nr:tRNA lysidine(34) synthetase TilS [Candidatus Omnitrophota bacterium]